MYFKPAAASGGFDISASSTDSDTGIASYGFPAGSALGTNWSAGLRQLGAYSFTAAADPPGAELTATNNAGLTGQLPASTSPPTRLAPPSGALHRQQHCGNERRQPSYDT